MQTTEKSAELEPIIVAAPAGVWHKPIATFVQAESAENGPGSSPDSGGIDYS